VRDLRISGTAAPAPVVTELMQYGIVPQSGYGMTETCSHQYTLPDDPPERIVETCGRACAGYEIRIWPSVIEVASSETFARWAYRVVKKG
jgi:acyl-CoA synthetase